MNRPDRVRLSYASVEIVAPIQSCVKVIPVKKNSDRAIEGAIDHDASFSAFFCRRERQFSSRSTETARGLVRKNLAIADMNDAVGELGDIRFVGNEDDGIALRLKAVKE